MTSGYCHHMCLSDSLSVYVWFKMLV